MIRTIFLYITGLLIVSQAAAQNPIREKQDSVKRMQQRIAEGWNVKSLNTAANSRQLSALEKEMVLEINMVRSNPQKYREMIMTRFSPDFWQSNRKLRSLLEQLYYLKPLAILTIDDSLRVHSQAHSRRLEKENRGAFHGSLPLGVSEICAWYGQPMEFGYIAPPRQTVIDWLWDDANTTPRSPTGHREAVLNKQISKLGVGLTLSPTFAQYWTVQFR